MKHAGLYSDLLPALKGKHSQLFLNRGTLISASALLPLQGFFWGTSPIFLFLFFVLFCLTFFIPVSVQAKAVMITTVNLNRDKHTETLDITNMHVMHVILKVIYPSILSSSSSWVLFFSTLSVVHFFSVLSRDFLLQVFFHPCLLND